MRTPRRAGVLAAVAASAALSVGGAGAALASSAAPVAPAAPANFCPAAPLHGATTESSSGKCVIKLQITVYVDGQPITFTAFYFVPFEKGRIFLHSTSIQVGTFQADGNGVATGTVTIPAGFPTGPHTLQLVGDEGTTLTTDFTVVAPTATGTGSGSTGGTLPFTGADVAGLAGGGVALIVGGALLTVVFRRRRATPTA